MHARVSIFEGGDVDELVRGHDSAWKSHDFEGSDGLSKAYVLVDRASGKALTITLWESEDAMNASEEQAKQILAEATEPAGASTQSEGHYEVALTGG